MDGNKLSYYDRATRELMEIAADDYDNVMVGEYTLPYAVAALREAFKQKLTYQKVFGKELFRECYASKSDPAQDFCLISSYYIYSRTGGDKIWELRTTGLHSWLQAKNQSEPFDITFTQFVTPHQRATMTYDYFVRKNFPYKKGYNIETKNNKAFLEELEMRAAILGKCAGLE